MENSDFHLNYKWLWLVIGYGLVSFVIFQTLTTSPVSIDVPMADKYMHTVGYFILMGWFVQIYQQKKTRLFWGVFFISMGISLEFLQDWGGVRFFEVFDMVANGLGVVIAWILSVTQFSKILQQVDRFIYSKL
jgi:VanZ family protein